MKENKHSRFLYLLAAIIGSSLVYLFAYDYATVADVYASYVAYPVLYATACIVQPIKNWQSARTTMHDLQARVTQLCQEKENLQAQVIALQGQVQYAHDIQEVRDYAKRYDVQEKQIAQCIARYISDQQHYLFVDKGSAQGIEKDMVAVYKNCLVGRVTEVYPWYSKVTLVTDRSCKVAAFCTQTKAQGIHEGCNTPHTTQLSFVSCLESVQVGDMVISSGEGLVFPRGFALGIIATCAVHAMHYRITLKPAIDSAQIAYCYLIKK